MSVVEGLAGTKQRPVWRPASAQGTTSAVSHVGYIMNKGSYATPYNLDAIGNPQTKQANIFGLIGTQHAKEERKNLPQRVTSVVPRKTAINNPFIHNSKQRLSG
jgi:hypothetical protein